MDVRIVRSYVWFGLRRITLVRSMRYQLHLVRKLEIQTVVGPQEIDTAAWLLITRALSVPVVVA
jgi:hypothetical protein